MRFTILSLMATLLAPSAHAFTTRSVDTKTSNTCILSSSDSMPYAEDKMPFYALGVNLAMQSGSFTSLLQEEELDIVLEAFRAKLSGATDPQDANAILSTFGPKLNELLQERGGRAAETEKKNGDKYATNFLKFHTEATQTDSGLVYLETTPGSGETPTMGSAAEVHYVGYLTDGTVIDSSVERGETMSFELSKVTKGWSEGLQLMKEGGKATLVIPSDLAYGDIGSGEVIPPGATLKFEIELLKVVNPTATVEPAESAEPVLLEQPDMEEIVLPDGSKVRVPKGVKLRLVDEEDEGEGKEEL